ncbi:uncharacterized protein LOC135236181 [Anguilla rostrata]|uniref:uncharacterized protein LOC135236181 n=1 Tax=Anguilla rostrata TaxID=7938 RepID=UPI0030D460C5
MDAERQAARAFGVPRPEKRRATPHLRSLSSYSRRIVCESADGWPSFSRSLQAPFCNMKIKIVNSRPPPPPPLSGKRRLDDSALEEGGSTPPRKRLAVSASTPGLGGAPDARGGPLGRSQAPPWSPVKALEARSLSMIRKAVGGVASGRAAPRSRPDPVTAGGGVPCAPSRGEAGSEGAPPRNALPRPESPVPSPDPGVPRAAGEVDADHAFDFDIEDILSLSPICSGASDDSEGIEAFIESCHSFYESSHAQSHAHSPADHAHSPAGHAQGPADHTHSPAVHAHSPAVHTHSPDGHTHSPVGHAQGPDGHAHSPAGRGGGGRKEPLSLDEGYFSRSYREALRRRPGGVGQRLEVSPLQRSSLALGAGPPSSSHEQVAVFGGGALPSPALCRNLLSSLDDAAQPGAARALQGVEGVGEGAGFSVGAPLFESWLRRGSFSEGNREAGGRGMTVKVELAERTWPSPCKENTGSPGDKGEPSNSAQLSPVQVRSVVVVPQKRADQDDAKPGREHLRRPVVYDREADWEREKELYVAAVTSHMADSTPCGGGVMTELVNLMKTVARQGVGNGNEPWQHPSDLTRRNYGGGAGKARISLDEWQQRNRTTHCRFADVPPEFQRTPVPQSHSA